MKNYSVLIIDDHPLISKAYKDSIIEVSKENEQFSFQIKIANDCDSAYNEVIKSYENNSFFDLVFLDIRLPSSNDGKFLSGEDIGLKIRQLSPETKIIVSTSLYDNFRIYSILKSLDPEGFLIKSDITATELIRVINTIISDSPYFSKSIIKLLRKEISNDFLLDNIDRRILYELSIGTRMKDIPNILPLSMVGIEKRKRRLKYVFDTKSVDDKELLYKAKEKGFIQEVLLKNGKSKDEHYFFYSINLTFGKEFDLISKNKNK